MASGGDKNQRFLFLSYLSNKRRYNSWITHTSFCDIFLSEDEYTELKKKKGDEKFGVKRTVKDSILTNKKVIGIHLFRGILRKHDVPYDDINKIPEDSLFTQILNHVERNFNKFIRWIRNWKKIDFSFTFFWLSHLNQKNEPTNFSW